MNDNRQITWNDITLRQLQQMEALEQMGLTPEELAVERMKIIFEEDVEQLSIPEFIQKASMTEILNNPIPKVKVKAIYNINGTEYEAMLNPFQFSFGQYIDFKNMNGREGAEKLLSLVLIPKGHKYNDGYDLAKVQEDILSLPVTDVNAIGGFFFRLTNRYARLIRYYLNKWIKRNKGLTTEEKATISRSLLRYMDLCYTLSPSSELAD